MSAIEQPSGSTPTAVRPVRLHPYAGDVTPQEAQRLMRAGALVVDVRYPFEYEYIGRVPGSTLMPWKSAPDGEIDQAFAERLAAIAEKDRIVLLLCRSGARSQQAALAAAAAGFTRVFNIVGGFEGDLDETGKRGRRNGWRHAGLDWVQS